MRAKDRKKLTKDLKTIYQVSMEEVLRGSEKFKERWELKYPKVVSSGNRIFILSFHLLPEME